MSRIGFDDNSMFSKDYSTIVERVLTSVSDLMERSVTTTQCLAKTILPSSREY